MHIAVRGFRSWWLVTSPVRGGRNFRAEGAGNFGRGDRHQPIAHPLLKFSPLRYENFDLPSRGRLFAVVAALVVSVLLVTLGQPAAAEEVIERFASDVSVARDGVLTVAETIRVRAEGDQIKRGIYRDFPLTFEDADGVVREVGFKLIDVTRDGRPEPHFTQHQGESIRIYAGKEDVFLEPGTYTYVITYETDRQIRWFDGKPELYWNVTGNGWAFPIQGAFAQVTLPDGAAPVKWTAYTGPYGARGEDFSGAVGSDGVLSVQTTRPLAPREGLTIVVEIPAAAVEQPSGVTRARYFLRDYSGWIIGVLGLAAVLGYYAAAWHAVGRDPKAGTIIPLFHPPKGVSPALANYIHSWGFGGGGWRAFTAAALSLAVRGLVVFDEKKGKELTLERTDEQPAGGVHALPPGEQAIFGWVEGKGGRADINRANASSVQSVSKSFRESITVENRDKFFRRNTLYFVGGVVLTVAVFVAIIAFGGLQSDGAMVLFPVGFVGLILGLVVIPTLRIIFTRASLGATIKASLSLIPVLGFFIAFGAQFVMAGSGTLVSSIVSGLARNPFPLFLVLVFPALNGLFFYLLRAPTALGRPVMDKLEGFRLYLETAESGRLNITGAPEITTERFEALLPYAVALDVERPWADAFAAALARAHPDDPDPMHHYRPRWSRGHAWSGDFGRSIASTVTGATTALASAMPRSSSGSSGFSGGGGSGGGGGGGGGGGW
jgi:uncharacterized membrane protein YgcG